MRPVADVVLPAESSKPVTYVITVKWPSCDGRVDRRAASGPGRRDDDRQDVLAERVVDAAVAVGLRRLRGAGRERAHVRRVFVVTRLSRL